MINDGNTLDLKDEFHRVYRNKGEEARKYGKFFCTVWQITGDKCTAISKPSSTQLHLNYMFSEYQ